MKVIEITDSHMWDSFVQTHTKDSGFLQSWAWGEFQASVGSPLWRLGVFGQHDNALKGLALLTRHRMSFSLSYLYAPRGPIMAVQGVEDMRVLDALTEYLHETPLYAPDIFVRFDAAIPETANACASLAHLGFRPAPHEMQPKSTLIIDLTKSEEQLLAEMHQKTRYNIRLAEKKGVKVVIRNDIEIFWSLLQETAKRDGFRTHSQAYYEKLFQVPGVKLFIAEYEGKVLAAAMVAFFPAKGGSASGGNNWALYLHGASSSQHRDLMAPHLLHWAICQAAKVRGCTKYDLWGADSEKWPGVTRFKQGFSPNTSITSYCGAWDYPLRSLEYRIYRRILRMKRFLAL